MSSLSENEQYDKMKIVMPEVAFFRANVHCDSKERKDYLSGKCSMIYKTDVLQQNTSVSLSYCHIMPNA